MDIVGFTALFSTRIVAYGCCLSLYAGVLTDGKTLPAVAVSCLCGLRVFRRCKRLSTFSRMWIPAFVPFCFFVQRRVVAVAPSGTLSHTLPGLCPRPRQGLPRPWMGGMRFAVGFTALFSPPTAYFCRPHSVWLGGITPSAGPRRRWVQGHAPAAVSTPAAVGFIALFS